MRTAVIVAWLVTALRPAMAEDRPDATEPHAELRIGHEVRDKSLVGELRPSRVASEGETLFAWARVSGLAGKVVEIVWSREDVEVARFATRIGSDRWRTWSTIKLPWERLYPAGGRLWSVEVRDAAGHALAVASFVASGPCSRTHDCE